MKPTRVNLTSLDPSNVPAACKDLSSNLTCATGTKLFLLSQILDYLPTLSRINALDHKCTKEQTTGNNIAGQNKIRARFLNTYTVLSVQQLSIKYLLQSNLVIRNFLITGKLFLKVNRSLLPIVHY